MKKQFIKDLPMYINGICVSYLFFENPNIKIHDIIIWLLAAITFI